MFISTLQQIFCFKAVTYYTLELDPCNSALQLMHTESVAATCIAMLHIVETQDQHIEKDFMPGSLCCLRHSSGAPHVQKQHRHNVHKFRLNTEQNCYSSYTHIKQYISFSRQHISFSYCPNMGITDAIPCPRHSSSR